ncbi:phage antirepressor KilAC domain-containing protein [Gluconobacter oxydans]|uniref:phage antirepressor KilAC domain-containing protein n=1 Tax=Gluconobacter oxydans TaxID=442 RepID=UPI0015583BD9|nr:phage antirepressor KilAC domain-containing protein [Gluconobacter oxydans]
MSNAIVSFSFEGVEVQAVSRNGDAWFVGIEVSSALGYASPDKAMKHCKAAEILKPAELAVLGLMAKSPRGLTLIPERDLYRLIMNSEKPTAQAFEERVVGEILPSIRKTGGYMVAAPQETPEELALRAVVVLQATLERQKEEARIEIERQKALIDEAAPKVRALDRIAGLEGTFNGTEAAKELQVGPQTLFRWMDTNEWTYKRAGSANRQAYQKRINAGDLTHKTTIIVRPDGTEKAADQVRITAQGLVKLARLVPGAHLRTGDEGEAA